MAVQRTAIDQFSRRVTRPVLSGIAECALSITVVVTKQRSSVKIALAAKSSLSPSLRLPAVSGRYVPIQDANCSVLALPTLAIRPQAPYWRNRGVPSAEAQIRLRILSFGQYCTRLAVPNT